MVVPGRILFIVRYLSHEMCVYDENRLRRMLEPQAEPLWMLSLVRYTRTELSVVEKEFFFRREQWSENCIKSFSRPKIGPMRMYCEVQPLFTDQKESQRR